jgi:HTH-type transcriptional regulator/antitoxin HigA
VATASRFSLTGKARNSYLELVDAFPLASIRSDEHLAAAQGVMDRLLARGGMDEGEAMYLDALSDLVATYEDVHHPIPPASDADLLRHFLEAKGVAQAVLSRETGISRSTISQILGGKKRIGRPTVGKLADYFEVSPQVFTIGS